MINGKVLLSSPSPKAPAAIGAVVRVLALAGLLAAGLSACTSAPQLAPPAKPAAARGKAPAAASTSAPAKAPAPTPTSAPTSVPAATPIPSEAPEALAPEVVVYASDLPESALTDELTFWDDPSSPQGKMIGLPNTGDELDPPPENDPAATFQVEVQAGIHYRCWIHMKVGAPKGKSQANMIWAQFSDAVDDQDRETLRPHSKSYLTAEGPRQEGWTWVACDPKGGPSAPLVRFGKSGPIAVRLQAGMEGVGFDQVLLSPARFLEQAPSQPIIAK